MNTRFLSITVIIFVKNLLQKNNPHTSPEYNYTPSGRSLLMEWRVEETFPWQPCRGYRVHYTEEHKTLYTACCRLETSRCRGACHQHTCYMCVELWTLLSEQLRVQSLKFNHKLPRDDTKLGAARLQTPWVPQFESSTGGFGDGSIYIHPHTHTHSFLLHLLSRTIFCETSWPRCKTWLAITSGLY